MLDKKKKVVVIGGGTGIFPVTAALRHLDNVEISTIISVSDNGGSTGRIRDEFGFQPVGDLRQSLAALAEAENEEWIRKLLLYRFDKGEGLKGHNLGNLILTALQDMTGDTSEALFRVKQIFRLKGEVIPSTNQDVNLKIYYSDGTTKVGENYLNPEFLLDKKVKKIELEPKAEINPYAKQAIEQADFIIIGPGDLYGSLLSPLLPNGTKEAFAKTKAKLIYISNLMTRKNQTDEMTVHDNLLVIEDYIDKKFNLILINNKKIDLEIISHYAKSGEHLVEDDMKDDQRAIHKDIIEDKVEIAESGDTLSRSYLRHSSKKLKNVLEDILKLK